MRVQGKVIKVANVYKLEVNDEYYLILRTSHKPVKEYVDSLLNNYVYADVDKHNKTVTQIV